MRARSFRRLFALLAVIAFAASVAIQGFAAADMRAPANGMAMVGEQSPSGMCSGCGGNDDGSTNFKACLSGCTITAFAVVPPVSAAMVPDTLPLSFLVRPAFRGRTFSPDPGPPRHPDLA